MVNKPFPCIFRHLGLAMAMAIALMSISAHAAIIHPSLAYGFINTANANSQLGTNLPPVTDYTASYREFDFTSNHRRPCSCFVLTNSSLHLQPL